jgi:hypothetical protein
MRQQLMVNGCWCYSYRYRHAKQYRSLCSSSNELIRYSWCKSRSRSNHFVVCISLGCCLPSADRYFLLLVAIACLNVSYAYRYMYDILLSFCKERQRREHSHSNMIVNAVLMRTEHKEHKKIPKNVPWSDRSSHSWWHFRKKGEYIPYGRYIPYTVVQSMVIVATRSCRTNRLCCRHTTRNYLLRYPLHSLIHAPSWTVISVTRY